MKKQKMVWVELKGIVVRIFKSEKAAFANPSCTVTEMPYDQAVGSIRHTIWLRSRGTCETCPAPLTEDTGHMHERKHRGKGGEISVENSVFICPACHKFAHCDRNPRWGISLDSKG